MINQSNKNRCPFVRGYISTYLSNQLVLLPTLLFSFSGERSLPPTDSKKGWEIKTTMATVKEARRNVRGAVEDNARRKKKGKRETEAVRGMHLNSSQHPFILPSPLLYLHNASCTERRKKKNSCSFFGIRNPGCTWKNALPIISPLLFLLFSLFFFDCLARDGGQRPPFCPRAPPFRGAPLLTRAIFREHQFGSRSDVFGSSDVPLTVAIQPAWREIMANLRLNYAFFLFPFFILHAWSEARLRGWAQFCLRRFPRGGERRKEGRLEFSLTGFMLPETVVGNTRQSDDWIIAAVDRYFWFETEFWEGLGGDSNEEKWKFKRLDEYSKNY